MSKPFRVPELLGRVRTQLRASGQLRDARAALRDAATELDRARGDAVNNRRLIDILHEVTGDLTATEIYRILTRRVAQALGISHCSVVLARPGETVGTVAAAAENSRIHDVEIQLDRYPEIAAALESDHPILVEDALTHPLFAEMREVWARERKTVRHPLGRGRSRSRSTAGVRACSFFAPTAASARLTTDDVEFADSRDPRRGRGNSGALRRWRRRAPTIAASRRSRPPIR